MPAASRSDLERLDLSAIVAGENRFYGFSRALDAKAKELAAAGDAAGAAVLSLLSDVASYGMRPDNRREPFARPIEGVVRLPGSKSYGTARSF